MEEINKCPYCGSKNIKIFRLNGRVAIQCRDCAWEYEEGTQNQ